MLDFIMDFVRMFYILDIPGVCVGEGSEFSEHFNYYFTY
jgi:hypothetical protein